MVVTHDISSVMIEQKNVKGGSRRVKSLEQSHVRSVPSSPSKD